MNSIHVISDYTDIKDAQAIVCIITEDGLERALEHSALFDQKHVLEACVQQEQFTGKAGQVLTVPSLREKSLAYYIFSGIGSKEDNDAWPNRAERYRRAIGHAIRASQAHRCSSVAFLTHNLEGVFDSNRLLGQETAIALSMAAYKFDLYLNKEKATFEIENTMIVGDQGTRAALKEGVQRGGIIAESVNDARYWIDLPPHDLTPVELAMQAQAIADEYGLHITTFGEQEVIEMGMGGIAAVSAGSEHDCRFVILEYKADKSNAPTLGFVGKGVTFDSGGLSLKPAAYMETMKEDMSGAAAVIATMKAIARLKPAVNIIAITPLTENLPSGKATKPGDIVRFYNGVTAEIKNTDAEGRLILADALAYMEKHYTPDIIVDLATLTGACQYALGPFFSGLMTTDDTLAQKLDSIGFIAGDALWRLPLTKDYKKAITSPVADIANIGSKRYMAGATTAGMFLQAFVEKTPWAHIDIAGTAFNVPDISYYQPESATGVGVRLLVALADYYATS